MIIKYPPSYHKLTSLEKKVFHQVFEKLTKLKDAICILWGGSSSVSSRKQVFSDIDLWVVTDKIDNSKKIMTRFLSNFDDIIYIHDGGYLPWLGEFLTLIFFPGCTFSIDIGFCTLESVSAINPGSSPYFLFGENKIIKQVKNRLEPKDYKESLKKRADSIFINGLKIRKNLSREQFWNCIEYINRARRELMGIFIFPKRSDPIKSLRPDRGIEKYLKKNEKSFFIQTYPRFDPSSISYCTSKIVAECLVRAGHLLSEKVYTELSCLEKWLKEFSKSRD